MYVGMGQVSTTDLSSVAGAIAGTTPAASTSMPCDIGWTYDPVSGVCVTLTTWQAVQDWLSTGNNALYAAGGIIGLILLGTFLKR